MDYAPIVNIPSDSGFGTNNIPFGAFVTPDGHQHLCTRIGDTVIDLTALDEAGFFDGPVLNNMFAFQDSHLNFFMSMGRPAWKEAREWIQNIFGQFSTEDIDNPELFWDASYPVDEVRLRMPFDIPDYTDFYSSEHHARNVGRIFRGNDKLMPNWKHIPIGYHGRAGSVILSGQDVHRPSGMILNADGQPEFSASQKVDFELEMGFAVGTPTELGQPLTAEEAREHIFGLVLVNDWSARDIQRFEYQPLGPFSSKNWATSISPWVVTLEALEAFSCDARPQEPEPAKYLRLNDPRTFDIQLEVWLKSRDSEEAEIISRSNYNQLYWLMEQQLAHQTVTGSNIRSGDLCASGTISGDESGTYGSMLELTWNGEEKLQLKNGEYRAFLEDGDEITLRAHCEKKGQKLSFGEVKNRLAGVI